MIHGARGLAALALVAVGLALAIAMTHSPRAVPFERSLFPRFTDSDVIALRWSRSNSEDVVVERRGVGAWALVAPQRAAALPRAVEAVLATLRVARWHRRDPRSRAGSIRTTVTIQMRSSQSHTVGIGDPIQGVDQAWIAVDEWAYLVDCWVVRAMDLNVLALRDREPLGELASTETPIRIVHNEATVDLQPRPWRDARGILAPSAIDPLLGALSRLRLQSIPSRVPHTERTTIELPERNVSLAVGGECPGSPQRIALVSHDGDGCIEAEQWNAVVAAFAALMRPSDHVLDRRLVAGDPATIQLPDGILHLGHPPTLEIAGAAQVADPARIAELVSAFAATAEVVPLPAGPPRSVLRVTLRSGTDIVLSRHGSTFVRSGETVGLRSVAADTIGRPIRSYIDPTRWVEDSNAVSALEVTASGRARFERGAVLGEWIRDGISAAPATTERIDSLVQAISQVRAILTELPPRWAPVCTVSVTFAPPVGEPITHQLVLVRLESRGCLARIDGVGGLAPPALCSAVMAVCAVVDRT